MCKWSFSVRFQLVPDVNGGKYLSRSQIEVPKIYFRTCFESLILSPEEGGATTSLKTHMLNRPCVAGAVLQREWQLIN